MKIDNDCIRDILFSIEEETTYENAARFPRPLKHLPERLKNYDMDKIMYHIRVLQMSNFLFIPEKYQNSLKGEYFLDLTHTGHELLGRIRSENNWSKTKDILGKIGAFGLDIVSATSQGVATAYLNKQLHLI